MTTPAPEVLANLKELVDTEGAGIYLGCTSRTVRTLAARGVLPAVRIPGSKGLRFRTETLRKLAELYESPSIESVQEASIR